MAPTLQQTEKGYAAMFDAAVITKPDPAAKLADRMRANETRYDTIVEAIPGMPWIFPAALHVRESDLNFKTHLHCGDSLNARTHHVPAGRPKADPKSGHMPYTFEESAIDALTMPGKAYHKIGAANWTVEMMLFLSEGYNGWGYLGKGNSPYVWSWTNLYNGGKYVADHVFNPNAWDTQPGVVAMYKALAIKDPKVAALLTHRAGKNDPLPKPAENEATRKERNTTIGGAAGGAAGTAGKATTEQPTIVHSVIFHTAIGVGVAIAIIGAILLVRKTMAVRARWEQLKGA